MTAQDWATLAVCLMALIVFLTAFVISAIGLNLWVKRIVRIETEKLLEERK